MPAALKSAETFGDDLTVLFVESQGAGQEGMESARINHKWYGNRGIWTTEHPFSDGSKGLPDCTLLGNDGEVLYTGSPIHQKLEELITEQIKLAKKGPKGMSPALQKPLADFNAGNYAAALKQLDEMKEGPDKDAAKKMSDALLSRAKVKLARLSGYISSGNFDEADKLAPQLAKSFDGHALADKVKDLSTQLAAKELEKEREAFTALERIEKKLKDGTPKDDAVAKQLNAFAQKYPNTRAAKRADHLAKVVVTKPS